MGNTAFITTSTTTSPISTPTTSHVNIKQQFSTRLYSASSPSGSSSSTYGNNPATFLFRSSYTIARQRLTATTIPLMFQTSIQHHHHSFRDESSQALYGILGNTEYDFGYGGNHMPNSSSANTMFGSTLDKDTRVYLEPSHNSPNPVTDSYKYPKTREFFSRSSYLKASSAVAEKSVRQQGNIDAEQSKVLDNEKMNDNISGGQNSEKAGKSIMAYDSQSNQENSNRKNEKIEPFSKSSEVGVNMELHSSRSDVDGYGIDISTTPNFFRDVHVPAVTTAPI